MRVLVVISAIVEAESEDKAAEIVSHQLNRVAWYDIESIEVVDTEEEMPCCSRG